MSIATREKSTELVAIKADETTLSTIEGIVGECSLEALAESNQFYRTMKLAAGINALRKVISNEMMSEVMALQGSSLGFRTDKDSSQGYPVAVVKDCMIEALLKGAYMVGNEMNIISSRAYFTKEFYTRKLREFPGLTDLKIKLGVPVLREGKAFVSGTAEWRIDGQLARLEKIVSKVGDRDVDERIPVKVNSGMSDDAILGKADRKMKKAIYDLLTGSETSDGDISDAATGEIPARATTLDAIAERLEGSAGASTAGPASTAAPAATATKESKKGDTIAPDLARFRDTCQTATLVTDVEKADGALRGPDGRELTEHEAILADAWKGQAETRIRAGRGGRGNQQQELA